MTVRPQRSSRLARRLAAFSLAAVTAVGVAGCAGSHPGTAAIVNGTTITEQDLDAVSHDLQPYMQPGQTVARNTVLTSLIMQPFVVDELRAANRMVSQQEASRAFYDMATGGGAQAKPGAPGPDEWAEPTQALAQAQVGIQSLSPANQQRVLQELSTAQIDVNPKYGTFDVRQGLAPVAQNWIDNRAPGQAVPGGEPQPQPTR